MALGAMTEVERYGEDGKTPLYFLPMQFAGDSTYPMSGTAAIEATVQAAAQNPGLELVGVLPGDCGIYTCQLVETQASVTSVATFPCADQDTNTIILSINGGAPVTVTFAGVHTAAATFAASFDAVAGIHSYAHAVSGQIFIETDEHGENASIQVLGGTANAVLLFPTTENVGTTAKKLMVRTMATGLEAQVGVGTTDLSGTSFHVTFVCR